MHTTIICNHRKHDLVTSTGVVLRPGENQLDAAAMTRLLACPQARHWFEDLGFLVAKREKPQLNSDPADAQPRRPSFAEALAAAHADGEP
jgi:hypothetical protein